MRRMTMALMTALGAGAALAGCDGARLDTRTFQLRYIQTHEAMALIQPYVFTGREGAPGMVSAGASAVTVRETPDNLGRIEQMLAEFDRPRAMVMLHFQVIRADGASEADPAIAEVERELRRLFRFEGYDLLAEARVGAMEGAVIRQIARGGGASFLIEGGIEEVRQADEGATVTLHIDLKTDDLPPSMSALETRVTVPVGHAVVLGTAETETSGALILVVRAEIAGGDAQAPGAAADTASPG